MKSENYKKPFSSFCSAWTFIVLPFHPISIKPVWHLLNTAWKSFVLIQQKQKLGLKKLPIVHVDHELDKKIPFSPSHVKIYLDFVHFFCRIIRMFAKRLGYKKGITLNLEIVKFVEGLYAKASTIYRHALSTTDRPFYIKSRQFVIIHFSDPHFLCVPSLHVAIVAGIWALVRQLVNKTDFSEEEKKQIVAEVFYGSTAITESVLYVKQHSINCVAGAFYMLTAAHEKGFFTPSDTENFVNSLFTDTDQISADDISKIREYIMEMYNNLLEQNKSQSEWQKPLHDWLDNYQS